MKISNIQEALQSLLMSELISVYEFSAEAGLAPSGLKKIIDGETRFIQMGTLRKINVYTEWSFSFEGDKIHFFKKQDKENQENADKDGIWVEVSEEEKEFLEIIKHLSDEQREALKTILKA